MRKIIFVVFTILVISFTAITCSAKESVWQENKNVSFSGGTRTVKAVYVDLKDKTIRTEAVAAKNLIGEVDELKNIAKQADGTDQEAVAAINGTFFNAYSDMQPLGFVVSKGEYLHMGDGSIIGFTGENTVEVDSIKTYILGSINGIYENPYNWDAWGFNHHYDNKSTNSKANTVFTPAHGKTTGKHSLASIVVDKGKVVKKLVGEANIPENGYVIVLGDKKLSDRFNTGDSVDYKVQIRKMENGKTGTEIDFDHKNSHRCRSHAGEGWKNSC